MLVKLKSEPHDLVLGAIHTTHQQPTAAAPQQEFVGDELGAILGFEGDRHCIDDSGFYAVAAHGLEPGCQ